MYLSAEMLINDGKGGEGGEGGKDRIMFHPCMSLTCESGKKEKGKGGPRTDRPLDFDYAIFRQSIQSMVQKRQGEGRGKEKKGWENPPWLFNLCMLD